MARNASVLSPRKDMVDAIHVKHEDGSQWVLLPNLELRMVKGPTKRGRKPKTVVVPEQGLF